MSAKITIDNITVKNPQANFLDPIQLEITFSNLIPLTQPIEWKIIYFGSAQDESYDQVLEEFEVPPVEELETMKFQLSCSPPDFKKIPRQELLYVTAMILTVSYRNQEFIRVGYYIHYQYLGEEAPEILALLPAEELVKQTKRTILFDKPRVTKFNIKWQGKGNSQQESDKEGKESVKDCSAMDEEGSLKNEQEQKQSTLEEKQQFSNSNQFSLLDSEMHCESNPIRCE